MTVLFFVFKVVSLTLEIICLDEETNFRSRYIVHVFLLTYPVRRLQQPVHRCQLVDQRQIDVESVQGRPRWIRKISAIRERIHVVQILDPARQGHFAQTLFTLYRSHALIVTL